MPGRFFLTSPTTEIATHLGADAGGLNEPPRSNISPGQDIIVGLPKRVLSKMRWGIIPVGRVNARGRPVMETVINARSETVFAKSAFDGVRRCLVPVDGWYEWTGEKRHKTAWRIARVTGEPIVFAGIYDVWHGPGGTRLPQVATLTCAPSADVRDIHHRMGVILAPEDFGTWLTGSQDQASLLMQPLTDGSLVVEEARKVDWGGA